MGVPAEVIKKALMKEKVRLESNGVIELPSRLKAYKASIEKEIFRWKRSSEAGWASRQRVSGNVDTVPPFVSRVRERLKGLPETCRKQVEALLENWRGTDPEEFNEELERGLLECIDSKDALLKEAQKAEQRAMAAGLGRRAARNVGIRLLRRKLEELLGVEGIFA